MQRETPCGPGGPDELPMESLMALSQQAEASVETRRGPVLASTALRGRDIVVFSNDWDGDPLSKTHIMRILSRDNRILWINSIGNRAPRPTVHDVRRMWKKIAGF